MPWCMIILNTDTHEHSLKHYTCFLCAHICTTTISSLLLCCCMVYMCFRWDAMYYSHLIYFAPISKRIDKDVHMSGWMMWINVINGAILKWWPSSTLMSYLYIFADTVCTVTVDVRHLTSYDLILITVKTSQTILTSYHHHLLKTSDNFFYRNIILLI